MPARLTESDSKHALHPKTERASATSIFVVLTKSAPGAQRPRSAAALPERSGGDDVGCNVWLGVIFQSEPFLRMHGTRAGQGYGLRHRLVHPSDRKSTRLNSSH